jgi:hypothetical protein
MPLFPIPDVSPEFYSEVITMRPRLESLRGSGGAPGVAQGAPITLLAQMDEISGSVALLFGIEDIKAVYEIHLSADPGRGFDEGATGSSTQSGPFVVIGKRVPAVNHCIFAVQGHT